MKNTNTCWSCGKKRIKNFRCKSCLKNKTTFAYSDKPNYNKIIDKGVKLKDIIQPYNKDGSKNYEFQSRYGDKIYKAPQFKKEK